MIVQEGIRRMYEQRDDVFYYLTVMNENYAQPARPAGARDGILRGLYRLTEAGNKGGHPAQILASGAILNEAVKAQKILAEQFNVAADVWSVTSYKELHRDALEAERWNVLHPTEQPRVPYVSQSLGNTQGPIIAASDYLKVLPDSICRWMPRKLLALGTDGFGRSDGRDALRDFFEVDARYIAVATLSYLAWDGKITPDVVSQAMKTFNINPEKRNPLNS